jgi:hypothetical protein
MAGLNGLVDGVGRDVFEPRSEDEFNEGVLVAASGMPRRDGSVPARVRPLVARDFVPGVLSADGCWKSGKPSPLGDSGMVSRNGVEWPEVGGPVQI